MSSRTTHRLLAAVVNDEGERRAAYDTRVIGRRQVLAGALGIGMLGLLAACGSDDENDPDPTQAAAAEPTDAPDSDDPTATSDEPAAGSVEGDTRTVETMHGMVEVPADPQRIVVLNYDMTGSEVLSLLEIPVLGIHSPPTTRPEIVLTGELNVVGEDDLDVEAVAALQPDLITGMYRNSYADYLDTLRQIAPVALLDGEAAIEWREVTRGFGAILNREADAEALIERTEERIAEVAGKIDTSKRVVVVRPNADGQFRAYTEASFPGLILAELGISIPDEFQELEESAEGTAGARGWNTLSAERIGELDAADFVIIWAYGAEPEVLVEQFLTSPLWDLLAVAQEERYFIGSRNWYGAGPISVNGALDDVEAALGS